MRKNKLIACLTIYAAAMLPQYALATLFCSTSPEGQLHIDDCKYSSYDECKRAIGNQGGCVADQGENASPSGVAPFCIVTWSTECKYYDYETCSKTAEKKIGFCYSNPDYKDPAKQ